MGVVGGVRGKDRVPGFSFEGVANGIEGDMPTVHQTHANGSVSTVVRRSNSIGSVPHLRRNNLNC